MDWYTSWIACSVVLTAVAFYPYFINLWKAEDELSPTISGWVSWMLSDAAIFAAQVWTAYQVGDYGKVGWQNLLYVTGPLVIIALSMRKGIKLARRKGGHYTWRAAFLDWDIDENGRRRYKDSVCVTIVALAVFVWSYKHDPEYAIYMTIWSTVIATYAITRPLRRDPYRENFWAWVLFLLGGVAGVVAVIDAIRTFDITNGLPPILFVGVQLTMVYLTGRRYSRRFAKLA